MTPDRKKPGVAFWASVMVVVMLVAYPLSLGPAWWVWSVTGEPAWLASAIQTLYAPLWAILSYGPDWLFDWFTRYMMGELFND